MYFYHQVLKYRNNIKENYMIYLALQYYLQLVRITSIIIFLRTTIYMNN